VPHFSEKNHEIKWIWETHFHNAFPNNPNPHISEEVEHRPFAVLCNHCTNPPCVRVCPTRATFKREDGIVLMDFHRCIGCRFCMAACPYGSRSFNFKDPRLGLKDTEMNRQFPTRMKGVVEKCNFCAERLAKGLMPACVETSDGAIVFGDLEDPHSQVREVLRENFTIRRKQNLGTEPCVYYIV
jgi:molybdopterin-containing oxidoreductase family iron-sulfur binding subunit